MNLLTITEDQSIGEKFAPYFGDVETCSIRDIKIDVEDNNVVSYVNGGKVEDYDSLFIRPTSKAITFTKIFLETLTESDINTSIEGASYYMIAKKPYLFKVLNERGVPIPKTYVVSSQKSATSLQKEIEGEIVCIQMEGFVRRDIMKTGDPEDMEAFSESLEHGKNYMLVQEFLEGDVYDCLYIDGDIISTKITGDSWRKSPKRDKCSEKYHKPPTELTEVVKEAAEAIGSKLCSVRIVDSRVVDIHMNPDIERFKKVSGKDAFEKVAEMLKPEETENGDDE